MFGRIRCNFRKLHGGQKVAVVRTRLERLQLCNFVQL
nr:MAG TPA: hypothetical protein [Bacteriophage sp.]DAT08273.1 MAG TPA: hypothetical protein [Caudoviricetes sp.]